MKFSNLRGGGPQIFNLLMCAHEDGKWKTFLPQSKTTRIQRQGVSEGNEWAPSLHFERTWVDNSPEWKCRPNWVAVAQWHCPQPRNLRRNKKRRKKRLCSANCWIFSDGSTTAAARRINLMAVYWMHSSWLKHWGRKSIATGVKKSRTMWYVGNSCAKNRRNAGEKEINEGRKIKRFCADFHADVALTCFDSIPLLANFARFCTRIVRFAQT